MMIASMKHELAYDGLILIWQLHGYGFKYRRTHIKLYFW